jgi:CheY-like chemotaxis protein
MTPDVLARCLEPFYTTKAHGHGTGLGLSTVYGLVNDTGGHMEIHSAGGEGTRVDIWLPALSGIARSRATGPGPTPEPPSSTNRVLLVEDDPGLLETAQRILSDEGFDVVAVASAEAALALLRGGDVHFDALVTDVMLPGAPGTHLVDEARQLDPATPVLYVTGSAGPDSPLQGRPQDDPVLWKPYAPDDLCKWVRSVIPGGPPS